MGSFSWKKAAAVVAVAAALVVAVALVAQSLPRPLTVESSARRVAGEQTVGQGPVLREFRAEYARWSRVLGVPAGSSSGIVTARRAEPGLIDVTFDLSDFGRDVMRLNADDLTLEQRAFGEPEGPGQSFRRRGNSIDATVRAADGSVRELTFDYAVAVFEPSLLELPLAMLDLAVGDEGYLAWSNFGDATDIWLPFRVRGKESVSAAGHTFDTKIVRVRFSNGRQRDYWISSEPPYKVRLHVYERGTLITSGWELESLEVFD